MGLVNKVVPLDRLDAFSSAIDGLRLRGRLTFEGVELDLPDPGPADPERVAGKLCPPAVRTVGPRTRRMREQNDEERRGPVTGGAVTGPGGLAAIFRPLDRTAQQHGGGRHRQLLGIERVLRAESAADVNVTR